MIKDPKFCRPIVVNNLTQLKMSIENSDPRFDFLEIWLDYLVDFSEGDLTEIINISKPKIVFLFRRLQLEKIRLPLNDRFRFLEFFNKQNCYIDLDITQTEELNFFREKDLNSKNLIVSFHSYTNTPAQESLLNILKLMQDLNPGVIKIACFCKDFSDMLRLLQIGAELVDKKQDCIITTMGPLGKLPRIQAAQSINLFNFAPQEEVENTASGQIALEQFIKYFRIFSN